MGLGTRLITILLTLKPVWASDVLSRSLSFIPQSQTKLSEWEIIIIVRYESYFTCKMHWVSITHMHTSSPGPFPAFQSVLHADVNGPGDDANFYYLWTIRQRSPPSLYTSTISVTSRIFTRLTKVLGNYIDSKYNSELVAYITLCYIVLRLEFPMLPWRFQHILLLPDQYPTKTRIMVLSIVARDNEVSADKLASYFSFADSAEIVSTNP